MFRDEAGTKAAKQEYKKKNGSMKGWRRDMSPKRDCWEGYSEGAAPTICMEGNNQHTGSHKFMHEFTSAKLKAKGALGKSEMSYIDARDLMLSETSKMYGCSEACLREQLDSYYCGKAASKGVGCPVDCKQSKVRPHDGKGAQPEDMPNDGFED